ncbi:hypothetical protein G9F31_06210 [Acinetobacter sp. 187]|uniref:hypothetical protein n=1 Tax=Acinetobacter lanii TaxID=2715163 RepID=UPI00140DEF84|nr:hypothetical protein [Acinetobacter lanii]NHC03360.1 hypothetical protein [Acinetobacter lanii]
MKGVKLKMREKFLSFKKYNLDNKFVFLLCTKQIKKYETLLKIKGAYDLNLLKIIKNIKKINPNLSLFMSAEIEFLKGNFFISLDILNQIEKYHEEIEYLKFKNYSMLGMKDRSMNILFDLLDNSSRKKTWMYLANSVESEYDFENFENYFNSKINEKEQLKDISLIDYYSEAAIRTGKYEKATDKWLKFIEFNHGKNSKFKKTNKLFSVHQARSALLNLREVLEKKHVQFFLVSGTLLGCIRENDILAHDKDLDVGIFEDEISYQDLIKIFQKSGIFEILPTRTQYQIKLKHLNGTYIDVFIHRIEKDMVWHYASKIKWYNKRFNLKKIKFLGHSFFIPENYNDYLCENYGENWKVPDKKFNSNFDTPNLIIYNQEEMKVFKIKMLAQNIQK